MEIIYLIALMFLFTISVSQAATLNQPQFCYLIGNTNPILNMYYVQNTTDQLFSVLNNGTFQKEIGANCAANNYAYGVDDDGTLQCRVDVGTGANVSSISNNTLFFNGLPTGFFQNGTDASIDTANTTAQMRDAVNQSLYYNLTVNDTRYFGGYTTGFFQNGTEIDTANTTTDIRNAVNQTLYYNLTSQMCYYLNNATQNTQYTQVYNTSYEYWSNVSLTNTYNTTYHSYIASNVSSIANNSLYYNGYTTGFFQNGTEIDTANTTQQMRDAVNQSLYYNFTAQMCYYLNNATQNTLYTQVFNSSYEYWGNVSLTNTYNSTYHTYAYNQTLPALIFVSQNPFGWLNSSYNSTYHTWAYNQTTPAISYINTNPFSWLNSSYNASYHIQLGHNTSSEIQVAINNTPLTGGYYNITAGVCYYVNNVTYSNQFYPYSNPYGFKNVTYNSSYEYWGNTSLTNTYNSSYHGYMTSNVSSVANNSLFYNGYPSGFFQNGTDQVNTTTEMRTAINQSLYYNLTSQMCYYLNNATQNVLYISVFNSSYEYWGNYSLSNTYNSTYHNDLGKVFNASYEYWGNTSLTNTYNITYHQFANYTYNQTYHNYVVANVSSISNLTYNIAGAVNNSVSGTIYSIKTYTSLICLNSTCLSNITKNDTGVYIFG